MVEKVYAFEYLPCVHEGSWGLVSLHLTEQGALKALEKHKQDLKLEFDKCYEDEEDIVEEFGQFEDWRVRVCKISK